MFQKLLSLKKSGSLLLDMAGTNRLKPLIPALLIPRYSNPGCFFHSKPSFRVSAAKMSTTSEAVTKTTPSKTKTIDSYLHIWASPEEAANKYPCFPGQKPTLPGNLDFLIQCMEEASVDGAPVVQPINDKFDHSLVTSALKKYPSKFVGCCLANPTEDGSGVKQLEQLVMKVISRCMA